MKIFLNDVKFVINELFSKNQTYNFDQNKLMSIALDLIKHIDLNTEEKKNFKNKLLVNLCKMEQWEMIKYTIENGADIHTNDNIVLYYSCLKNNLDMVKYSIEHGADISSDYYNSFYLVCRNGYLDILRYFIENINLDIHYKNSGLLLASQNGHLHTINYLISQGAVTLFALQGSANSGHLHIIKYMINNYIFSQQELNEILIDSIKFISTHNNNLDTIQFLVETCNIHIDEIAINVAIGNRCLEVVKYLFEKSKHNIEITDTMIILAVTGTRKLGGNLDVLKFLIHKGANIDTIYSNGILNNPNQIIKQDIKNYLNNLRK